MDVEVSVVMPVYNSERYIGCAMNSVLSQCFQRLELIVVDDRSTDNTLSIVKEIAARDSRVKLFRLDVNSGPAAARNKAIEMAKGRYVAFLDSDDYWLPGKLECQLKYFKGGVAVVFSSYIEVDADGREIGMRGVPDRISYNNLLRRNYIGNLTAVYDRQMLPDIRFEAIGHEDYAFWLRALRESSGVAVGVSKPLAKYRIHSESLSSNKLRAVLWTWKIYRYSEGISVLGSGIFLFSQLGGALLQRIKSILGRSRAGR